ncbi:MAG: hypothetical protein FWC46_00750, partial [Actinomycetia bacterium]|nr:hypothetical protein [Actinomycetes bacterium]
MTQQMPPSWVTQACPAVSLRTPPDWRVVPPPPMEYPPALIVAGPPRHGFAPNVTVTLDPLPPAMTLAEWHTINLESLRQALTSLRLLDLQPDEVDGAPALIRLCAYGMDDHPLSLIQWLV